MSLNTGMYLTLQSGFMKASGTFEAPDIRLFASQHEMPRLLIAEGTAAVELEFTDLSCLERFVEHVQASIKALSEVSHRA